MTLKQFKEAKIGDKIVSNRNLDRGWLPNSGDRGIICSKTNTELCKNLNILWENEELSASWSWFYYEDEDKEVYQNISSLDLIDKNKQLELEF